MVRLLHLHSVTRKQNFHIPPSGHQHCLKFFSIACSSSQRVSDHDYTQNHTFLPTTYLHSLLSWFCPFAVTFHVVLKPNAKNERIIGKQSCLTAHFISETFWWKKNILLNDVHYRSSTKINLTHVHKKYPLII